MSADQELKEAVRDVLQSEGITMAELATVPRDLGLLVNVVVGPIKEDWRGVPDPDGERDRKKGSAYRAEKALDIARALENASRNGGIPAKLSPVDRAAIWTASGTLAAAVVTGFVLWIMNTQGQTP